MLIHVRGWVEVRVGIWYAEEDVILSVAVGMPHESGLGSRQAAQSRCFIVAGE